MGSNANELGFSGNPQNIAFLVGAGASIPAHLPTTNEITAQVLSGEGFSKHTDERYYRMRPLFGEEVCPNVMAICKYLKVIHGIVSEYYAPTNQLVEGNEQPQLFSYHTANYEDLYYVASQLRDSGTFEYENPAVQPLEDHLEGDQEFKIFRESIRNCVMCPQTLSKFHDDACSYIEAVVAAMLSVEPSCLPMASLLSDSTADPAYDITHIFTLNHDRVLEATLGCIRLPFTDGFGAAKDGLRRWTPSLMDDGNQVKLLKLHGDIRWSSIPLDNADWRSRRVCIVEDPEVWSRQSLETVIQDHPGFLLGTHNKILSYSGTIFADLYFRYYKALEGIDAIVVIGYSFGDKGINTRLLDWVHAADDHRMVIIDPRASEISKYARGAVRLSWEPMLKAGKLALLPKKLEDIEWSEVQGFLSCDAV